MRAIVWLLCAGLLLSGLAVASGDDRPPVTSVTLSGRTVAGGPLIVIGPATSLVLAASDVSGVAQMYYRLDGGAVVAYAGPISPGDVSGEHEIAFWSVDVHGNVEDASTWTFMLDADAPSLSIVSPRPRTTYLSGDGIYADETGTHFTLAGLPTVSAPHALLWEDREEPVTYLSVRIEAEADDEVAGMARVQFFDDGELFHETSSVHRVNHSPRGDGEHVITLRAMDRVGNVAEESFILVKRSYDA